MRKWKVMFAMLAAALVVPAGFGQTKEDMQGKLHDLEKRLAAVEAENAALKARSVDQDGEALENQVNALLDRYAGTTVNSVANPITMTGEFRFRNNWQSGDPDPVNGIGPGDEYDGSWQSARVRLGFMYEFTGDVTAYAELQSSWVHGDSTSATWPSSPNQMPGLANAGLNFAHGQATTSVAMYQAWVEVRNVFNRPEFSSRTGRQEIVLGNQFQFGNADWYHGWVFDGSVWTWEDESFRLVGIIAKLASVDADLNQQPSYLSAHDDDELYAVYFTLKTIENHELDLYWIYINGHSPSANSVGSMGISVGGAGPSASTAYYHTFGARIGGTFPDIVEGLDWNAEIAFQTGDLKGSTLGITDISGLAIEGEVGVTVDKENMLRVFARVLFAEGPSTDESGYIPLWGNRHSNTGFRARYGIFDLIPMFNVFTLQGGVHFNPDPAWTLGATVIWATAEEAAPAPGADDDYGWEIDVWGEYRFTEQFTFGGGLALLFPDDEGVALWGLDDGTHVLVYIQARLLF